MNEDQKLIATSGSAVGISAIASLIGLCCIGPWAVALFGVSGAVAMARWEPIRPYLVILSIFMLSWAFWRVYGPVRRKLCEAKLCSNRPSVWLQASLWLALAMVLLALFADQLQIFLIDPAPDILRQ